MDLGNNQQRRPQPRGERLEGNSTRRAGLTSPSRPVSAWLGALPDTRQQEATGWQGNPDSPSNLTSRLQKIRRIKEQIKWQNEEVVSQIKMWDILQDNWPCFSTNKWHSKWEGEQLQIKRDLEDTQANVMCGPHEDSDSNWPSVKRQFWDNKGNFNINSVLGDIKDGLGFAGGITIRGDTDIWLCFLGVFLVFCLFFWSPCL